MQTLNEVEILGRKYSQFNEFLDAIPKVFNIFVDTSAVYFFPHKNGNSIDFLFKAAKDPENPISNKKNKYELIKAFYDHIDYLNKISKKRDIFVTLEIRGEIQKSLKRIKK